MNKIKNILFIYIFFFSFPYFAESPTLQKILKSKVLTISVNQLYEPFYIADPIEGSPGFDVELAQEYADFLGVGLRILPLTTFDEHATRLAKGDTQIAIAGLSSNLERFKTVYFTDPYLYTSPAGLVNRQILPPEPEGQIITSAPFRSLADLNTLSGISFSVLSNSSNHKFLKKFFSKNPIYSYSDSSKALNELKKNNVNVYVADGLSIQALLQKEPNLKSSYLPLIATVQEDHLVMAVNQQDLEFIYHLNFFIKELRKNGKIDSLSNKYFMTSIWVKK